MLFRQAGENNSNNKIFQLWQQDNHPIECGSPTILRQKMDYVHENPLSCSWSKYLLLLVA